MTSRIDRIVCETYCMKQVGMRDMNLNSMALYAIRNVFPGHLSNFMNKYTKLIVILINRINSIILFTKLKYI